MALAVRAVGAWSRVVSDSVARSSCVRSAVEPTRKAALREVALGRGAIGAGVRVVSSGEVGAQLRCRVAASAVVREFVGTQESCRAVDEQSRMYYGRRGGGDAYLEPLGADDAAEMQQMGRSEMVATFEAALRGAGRNADKLGQLAARAWRKLGDADRAEQLYTQALQLAPNDSTIQASYAQFLWQCDAQGIIRCSD